MERLCSRCATALLAASLLVAGCDGENEVVAPRTTTSTAALSGTVLARSGGPVAGAEIRIGGRTVTSAADGHFELTGLTPGPATLRSSAAGFQSFEARLRIPPDGLDWDFYLDRVALFEFGDFALYVPPAAPHVRGVFLALGGPDTRAFAAGSPFGAPIPEVETALQTLGRHVRAMADSHGLAVLGTSVRAMANGVDSDRRLLDALDEAAGLSVRPELADAPLLLYGIALGAPEASGLAARHPDRAAGLFLKVPTGAELLTGGPALAVPTYVVLAELDAFVDNAALTAVFRANRSAGGLWALAEEAAVPHHSLTGAQRYVTIHWMGTILDLRLGDGASSRLRPLAESSGWLGDHATRGAAAWTSYAGDPMAASWFPSQATAELWAAFVGDGHVGPFRVFDLTALVEKFDPTWGDQSATWYTAVVNLPTDFADRPTFEGSFSDWYVYSDSWGDTYSYIGTAAVRGRSDGDRGFILEAEAVGEGGSYSWYMRASVTDSGHLEGTWESAVASGPFEAYLRKALPPG